MSSTKGHLGVWPRPHQQDSLLPGLASEAGEAGGCHHLLGLGMGDQGPGGSSSPNQGQDYPDPLMRAGVQIPFLTNIFCNTL
jgi:hypothetical protein